MYIRRFKYKPDDVDCRLCTEFRKRKCTLEGCPWIAERIEAGVVSYAEAVMKVFSSYGLLRHRLADLVDSYPGTFWIDERHRNRMEWFKHRNADMGKKDITIKVRLSPDELKMIQEKMEQFGTDNMSAFIRKMAIDGYVVKLEIPELKEILSLLRYSSNNLNQLTKRVHETGRIYDADLEDIHRSQDRIWTAVEKVVATLAKL